MCFKSLSGVFLLLTFLSVMGELTKYPKQGHNETKRIRHHGSKSHNKDQRQHMAERNNLKSDAEKGRSSEPSGEILQKEDGTETWETSSTNPNLCPETSCIADFEMSRQNRIMQIQDQFLKESGLKQAPNMTGVVISENPQLRFEILHTNNQESVTSKQKAGAETDDMAGDDPNFNIKKEKVFITASTERPDFIKLPIDEVVVYFNLSKEHISSIASASLHFWLQPNEHIELEDRVAIASIYKISVKIANDYPQLTEVYNDIKIPFQRGGDWFKVDIFSLARDWIHHPENNFGLSVVLTSADNKLLSFDSTSNDPAHAPLLELDVVEERNDRRKRYAGNRTCKENKIDKICCKYPLIVNFVDFQWDFIVAPKRYEANYCRGECPFVFAQKYPHSTLLQTKFNNTNSTHGPCCGARVLDPLRMVYYDGANIKVSTIKDMVVKQCSCT